VSNILLGVTGSVAAIRTPALYRALTAAGHTIKVVATQASLYFFDPLELDPARSERNPEVVILDEDEWPGRHEGRRWRRDDSVLHIELRRWADLLLIAPLDANTLAKIATGLADNCLTCVWRAWNTQRPVVLAPAMNTLMWENRLTALHLFWLAHQFGGGGRLSEKPLDSWTSEELIDSTHRHLPTIRLVGPIEKSLACGDTGVGAMAEVDEIVASVRSMLQR